MNTLKPLLIMAIVSGIGYGVWNRLNRKPDAPPPGAADGWDGPPKVQLGDGSTQWSGGGPPGAVPAGAPPAGAAVPYSDAPAQANGAAGAPAGQPLASAPPFGSAPTMPASGGGAPPADGNWRSGKSACRRRSWRRAQRAEYSTDPGHGAPGDPGTATPPGLPAGGSFMTVLETARRELDAGHLAEGLMQLSAWYDNPQLSPTEQQQLNVLLDQVAGSVIYSTKDLLEPPYEVQPGDRLDNIGERYNVPWQLLAKINGIEDPQALRPGDRLKIVRGPFEAVVSLEKRQLTLLLNGAYAGRFAIGIGHDYPREGRYTVVNKVVNPEYHGLDRTIGAGDPANPLGTRWLGLDGDYGIHGTNDPNALGRPEQAGCIGLGPRDVEDLFDILSVGSRITIRR